MDRYQDVDPTKQQTGTELFELVHLASGAFPRVTLYFENSILQPDLAICGGITEARRIDALASAYNLRLAPHLWAGAPAFFAGLHVAAASSSSYILEYSLGANPMLHDLIEEEVNVVDGMIDIPDRPGLGITVRDDVLAAHAVRTT